VHIFTVFSMCMHLDCRVPYHYALRLRTGAHGRTSTVPATKAKAGAGRRVRASVGLLIVWAQIIVPTVGR